MAVLLGAVNQSGKTIINKIKRMYSSVPAAEYERFLFRNANHRNPNVKKFVREKLEQSFNPRGLSILKAKLKKYYNN